MIQIHQLIWFPLGHIMSNTKIENFPANGVSLNCNNYEKAAWKPIDSWRDCIGWLLIEGLKTPHTGLAGGVCVFCLPGLVHMRRRMCFALKPPLSSVNCSHKQAPARCEPLPTEDNQCLAVSGIHNQTCPLLAQSFCLRQIGLNLKPNTTDLLLKLKLSTIEIFHNPWKDR